MQNAATQITQAVRDLVPMIAARSPEIETARRLPQDILQALIEAGCFRMLTPRSHGGDEVDLLASIEILEILAAADGATGWTVMIGCETAQLLSLLPRKTFDTIYADNPNVIIGGGFAPQGEAQVVDGGYRVNGRWAFASGCQHCSWLIGTCVVTENGQPRPGASPGVSATRTMLFRSDEVEILDTWKTSGMRGTGSHDIAVSDLFIPEDRTLDLFMGQSCLPGPLFRFPTLIFSLHIAAVAVGIAQGALEDVVAFIKTKKQRLYASASLAETPLVQFRLGHAESTLRAARAFLHSEAERLWQLSKDNSEHEAQGTKDPNDLMTRVLAADSWIAETCAEIVDRCYTVGGGQAIYEKSSLQRRLRDIHTLTQHASLSESAFTRSGAALVGQPVGLFF